MKILLLVLSCLIAGTVAFLGTLTMLDRPNNRAATAARSTDAVPIKLAQLTAVDGADLKVGPDSAILTSRFSPNPGGAIRGAAYINFTGTQIAARPGRRLNIEVEASGALSGQAIDVLYVQNGLQASGWIKLPLAADRRTYTASYAAPPDKRGADRIDTLWIRGDAEGAGRPVTLHAVRLVAE